MKKKGANYYQDKKINEDKEKKEDIIKKKLNAVKKKVANNYQDKKINEDNKKDKKKINVVKNMVANNYQDKKIYMDNKGEALLKKKKNLQQILILVQKYGVIRG